MSDLGVKAQGNPEQVQPVLNTGGGRSGPYTGRLRLSLYRVVALAFFAVRCILCCAMDVSYLT